MARNPWTGYVGVLTPQYEERLMIWTCLLVAVMAGDADSVLSEEPLRPGDLRRVVTHHGLERNYLVHVPKSYDAAKSIPVVLVLHGGGSNAAMTVRYTGMNEKADQAGFLAVYPNGTGRVAHALTWNAGNCCGYAQRQQIDDVGFMAAVLDDLDQIGKIDERRIYATGISNGGMLAYRLANEMSERVAAIAPVAGTLGFDDPKPTRPVPVIQFHGTEDRFVPLHGGRGIKSITQTNFHSVEKAVAQWAKLIGCPDKPRETKVPHVAKDDMHVTRREYGPGKNGAELVFYLIEGGGHTWPGRQPLADIEFLGPSTGDISANDLMWEFFVQHPLPDKK